MKTRYAGVFAVVCVAWVPLMHLAAADVDEFKVKREAVFEFEKKPVVTRAGDNVTIEFTSKGFCDVTVAIEDDAGKIIRHLASGVLGPKAPEPFQKNSKQQVVAWDGKDDPGGYVDDKASVVVRVSLGLKPQFEKNVLWEPKRRVGHQPILVAGEHGVYVYESGSGFDSIRLFSHFGEYVRTVYPPASDTIEKMEGLQYREYPPDGKKLPVKHGWYQGTLLTSGLNYPLESDLRNERAATAMAVNGKRIGLAYLRTDRESVAFGDKPARNIKSALPTPGSRPVCYHPGGMWVSPDGHQWDQHPFDDNLPWFRVGIEQRFSITGK